MDDCVCVCAASLSRVCVYKVCVCVCSCPMDTLRFNLITADVMEKERGAAATDGLNRMER